MLACGRVRLKGPISLNDVSDKTWARVALRSHPLINEYPAFSDSVLPVRESYEISQSFGFVLHGVSLPRKLHPSV